MNARVRYAHFIFVLRAPVSSEAPGPELLKQKCPPSSGGHSLVAGSEGKISKILIEDLKLLYRVIIRKNLI